MKKYIIILFLFFSISLFAEKSPFSFNGYFVTYGTSATFIEKDKAVTYGALRFRPVFSHTTEQAKVVFGLEIDEYFGSGPSDQPFNQYHADFGNDELAVKVKNLYLQYHLPFLKGLSLKAGIDTYRSPGGIMIYDDVALVELAYNYDQNYIKALFIKPVEGEVDASNDDIQIFGLDTFFMLDNITLRPAFYFYRALENAIAGPNVTAFQFPSPFQDGYAMVPQINANIKMGSFNINATFLYGFGKSNKTDTNYSGFAADLDLSYQVTKQIKPGLFFTYISGDKDGTTGKKSFANFMFSPYFGKTYLFQMMNLLQDTMQPDFNAIIHLDKNGYVLFGGYGDFKTKSFEGNLTVGYALVANAADGREDDFGLEVDFTLRYLLAPTTKISMESSYLKTGDAFKTNSTGVAVREIQDSVSFSLGMEYLF